MKKVSIIIGIIILIGGGIFLKEKYLPKEDLLTKYKLNDLDKKELVEKLENPQENNLEGLGASISSDRIEFSDGNETQTYKFDGDEFYISIAPYINTTHS